MLREYAELEKNYLNKKRDLTLSASNLARMGHTKEREDALKKHAELKKEFNIASAPRNKLKTTVEQK